MSRPPREFTKSGIGVTEQGHTAAGVGQDLLSRRPQILDSADVSGYPFRANRCQGFGAGGTGTAKNSTGSIGSSPASLAFGSVTVGQNQSIPTTLINNGGSAVSVSQIGISGTGFTLSGVAAPLTLAAGQSATFSVKFAPTTSGTANGSLTVSSDASSPSLTIPISGTGTTTVGQLSVNPGTLPFGNVVDGSSATASGSLTATGANVTVTGATTNNSVFSVGGLSLPVTIAAGQSVPFNITFSPQTPGSLAER